MQSKTHKELIQKAITWLSGRCTGKGMRWSTEFFLKNQYVADAVVFHNLQIRFWNQNSTQPESLITVFESKISKSDFLAKFPPVGSFSNRKEPVGNFHYAVVTRGLVQANELPDFWGLLEESKNGLGLIIVKPASFIPISPEEMHRYGHWMLWSGNSDRMIEEKKDFEKKYFPRGFCKVCGQMH